MSIRNFVIAGVGLAVLAGCQTANTTTDKLRDRQIIGRSSLQELSPGIWVDPRGCQHWLIDDGVEGYLSTRFDPQTGLPACNRSDAPPEFVTGPFRAGQDIGDPI